MTRGEVSRKPRGREYSDNKLKEYMGQTSTIYTAYAGTVYDIGPFLRSGKHPGGTVIRLAAGRDATSLIESYHPHSGIAKVQSYLDKYCPVVGQHKAVRNVPSSANPNAAKFWQTVSSRVETYLTESKIDRHREFLGVAEAIVTLIAYVTTMYFKTVYGSFFAALLLGWVAGRLGFLMHMGNHAALSKYPFINRAVGAMMDLAGASSLNWSFDHQVSHHQEPNVPDWDNDANIGAPWIRLHPSTPRHWCHKYQHITAFIAMSGGFFNWYFSDIRNFWDRKVGVAHYVPTRRDWAHLIFFKSMYIVVHFVLPYWYGHSWWTIIGTLFVWMIAGAQYMENTFIVNHIQHGLVPPSNDLHWSDKQVYGSANWASRSHFWNWWSAGLNHQIEHHLFPSISHYNYPIIAHVVESTCKEFNLPYHNYESFSKAWWEMNAYLRLLGTAHFD